MTYRLPDLFLRRGYILWLAFILFEMLSRTLASSDQEHLLLLLAVVTIPLLLPCLLARKALRRFLWLSIILLAYVCHAIVWLWTDPSNRLIALIEALASTSLIIYTLMLAKRMKSQRGTR